MNQISAGSARRKTSPSLALSLAFSVAILLVGMAQAQTSITQISSDSFTNPDSQHKTELEQDTFAFGSTIVSTFQVGRFVTGGGASDLGFATSTDAGKTWTQGVLPGTTVNVGGPYDRISDPTVAYDAAHGVWIITGIAINNDTGVAVVASTSADGINWGNPVVVNSTTGFDDKEWIACDNTSSSPFYGHCYVEWDEVFAGDQVRMSTSTNGGLSWGAYVNVPNAFGLGGQPVVQPSGTVVVPFTGIQAFTSTNGGATWTSPVTVSNVTDHGVAGDMRTSALPSAGVDGAGKVYVAWQDCRFRTSCSANDIVISTSTDGKTWSAVSRVPIDPTTSTADHFIPGLAVDPATSGSTSHLALTYYFFPVANCTTSTCRLSVGFTQSTNGGRTWTKAVQLGTASKVTWVADTDQGRMVGDYTSTSFVNGKAFGAFAIGKMKTGSTYNEATYTMTNGLDTLTDAGTVSSIGDVAIPGAKSDHGARRSYDQEGLVPIPPALF